MRQLRMYEPPCCPPLEVDGLTVDAAERMAVLVKALADPLRLRLKSLIAASDESCVGELAPSFDQSQPTISHHLRVLRDAGLVDSERRGTWVYYRARQSALDVVGGLFGRRPARARR